jgi:hypothetical protein
MIKDYIKQENSTENANESIHPSVFERVKKKLLKYHEVSSLQRKAKGSINLYMHILTLY